MSTLTQEQVMAALRHVQEPELNQDLVTLGMIEDLKVDDTVVSLTVMLTTPGCPLKAEIHDRIFTELAKIGVTSVNVGWGHKPRGQALPVALPGIQHVIAIGSGKGGVGKSTVSVNLAISLSEMGARVGLLDADIYGPSIPMMMGADERPRQLNNKLVPVERHGVKLMSMGFLLPNPEDPVIWRGPMLHGVIQQFLNEVDWGELDYLLIDMPPGTGDVPLSLSQSIPLSGVVIVITPQPVAASIGMKTLKMFETAKVPILGIVENMSYFVCPSCTTETNIFSRGGGRVVADAKKVPFLGEVPLDPKIREGGDTGAPVTVSEPQSPQAEAFRKVTAAMVEQVHCQPLMAAVTTV
ncbi:MAG: Mrp/NBP35 family ATP-binding protein [Candidatus Sericytochromatia bacterium]|nr:Mrp/NBP35 family ATP-binding protein [Candidatus Sericytochromatia bacterium]